MNKERGCFNLYKLKSLILMTLLVAVCFSLYGCLCGKSNSYNDGITTIEEYYNTESMLNDFIFVTYLNDFNQFPVNIEDPNFRCDNIIYEIDLMYKFKEIVAGKIIRIPFIIANKPIKSLLNWCPEVRDDQKQIISLNSFFISEFAKRDLTYHCVYSYFWPDGSTSFYYNCAYLLYLPAKLIRNLYWDIYLTIYPNEFFPALEKEGGNRTDNRQVRDIATLKYRVIFLGFILLDIITVIIGLIFSIVMLILGTILGLLFAPGLTIFLLVNYCLWFICLLVDAIVYIFYDWGVPPM